MLIAVLKNKFIVSFIIIFGTLLFPMWSSVLRLCNDWASVRLSRQSTAKASAGGFAAERSAAGDVDL